MANPAIMVAGAANAATRMLALAPTYQFRADTVTLSAGNVATIPNRRGSDALVVAAGTLAAPVAGTSGAQKLVFGGTQWLDSSLAASAWKFLHDGTGCEVFHVCAPASIGAGTRVSLSTQATLAVGSIGATLTQSTAARRMYVANGAAASVDSSGGTLTANVATYHNVYLGTAQPLVYNNFVAEASVGSGNAAAATPSSSNPANTLRLGALGGGGSAATEDWYETIIFPRVLHEYERQIVREYIGARYGIAAPSLTGADRDIMSMLPFSGPRADAYNTSGGKVTSFLDRARPGHTFAQGNSSLQVVNPTADAALNGQLSAPFIAANPYVSSLASSAWRFLHDGTGQTVYLVLVPTNIAAGNQWYLSTRIANGAAGDLGFQSLRDAGRVIQSVLTASAAQVTPGTMSGSVLVSGTGCVIAFKYVENASPEYAARAAGAQYDSGNSALAPSASNPSGALVIGALTSGLGQASMRFAEALVFNRALTAAEDARVAAYMLSRYGKAA